MPRGPSRHLEQMGGGFVRVHKRVPSPFNALVVSSTYSLTLGLADSPPIPLCVTVNKHETVLITRQGLLQCNRRFAILSRFFRS